MRDFSCCCTHGMFLSFLFPQQYVAQQDHRTSPTIRFWPIDLIPVNCPSFDYSCTLRSLCLQRYPSPSPVHTSLLSPCNFHTRHFFPWDLLPATPTVGTSNVRSTNGTHHHRNLRLHVPYPPNRVFSRGQVLIESYGRNRF